MLIDSHCHLDFPDFAEDRTDVIARARAAGVAGMLTICTKMADFEAIHGIARDNDGIWCSVGVHPHEASGAAPDITETLVSCTDSPEVVGIGEAGLDFHYDHSPRDTQERVFRAHLAAARETGLPVIVHTREADDRTVAILDEEQEKGGFPGLIHCFSAGAPVAMAAMRHGMYVSFSGIVTFKNAEAVREVARQVPMDRLLVETDAPYLAPAPHRGKRNEPAFTADTARALAEIKGIGIDELTATTTDNFFRLFAKADRGALPASGGGAGAGEGA
jgi:TatD DNase family protein